MSSVRGEISVPWPPEVREVSAGICAYVQSDRSGCLV